MVLEVPSKMCPNLVKLLTYRTGVNGFTRSAKGYLVSQSGARDVVDRPLIGDGVTGRVGIYPEGRIAEAAI